LFQFDPAWFRIDSWFNVLIIVGTIAFLAASIYYGIKAHRGHVSAGKEDLIGKIAEVLTDMKPKGEVFIQGERWKATLNEGHAQPGEEVTVTKVDGLKLWVSKK